MLKKYANSETINQNWVFYCEKCDYGCNKKFLFSQHLKTKKHLKQKCSNNAQKNMQEHLCCKKCGKQYKHIQSYKRHVRKCVILAENPPKCENVVVSNSNSMIEHEVDIEKQELRNMVTTLITQNQAMLMENKEMREMVHDMLPKIGSNNTTINNRFNLQVFLNEKCKDAINLSEFVESLQLELGDLENTTQVGFVGGVAKIFVKGLRELDLHKRPIHCSDLKRDVLYVRDNDTWKKDSDNNKHVKAAINYNDLLGHFGLGKQYEKINEAQKIRWVYLKQNTLAMESCGYKGYEDPPQIIEFIKTHIDHKRMYAQMLEKKIMMFYESLKWNEPVNKKTSMERFF